jgi:hypothetical protein
MDTTEFSEGQYITPKLVNESQQKIGVILGEARPEDTKYGKQLSVNVELNKKIKTWNMNRDSVKNLQRLGTNSESWIGKKVTFTVVSVGGKDGVIGMPVME